MKIAPDVIGGDASSWSHRQIEGADWYFVSAPRGRGFKGTLDFRNNGEVELWDPVTGRSMPVESVRNGERTTVKIDLARSSAGFIVFRNTEAGHESVDFKEKPLVSSLPIEGNWTLAFPKDWGAPARLDLAELKPWKDLDISSEGKAFSGTATYTTTFDITNIDPDEDYILDLGDVDMAAAVSVNGGEPYKLWAVPFRIDITDMIKVGKNTLSIDVTSTWFNRLVYDARLPKISEKHGLSQHRIKSHPCGRPDYSGL